MVVASNPERLSELGQVWGDASAFETFKRTVQEQHPEHWETLRAWFQAATRDRGFLLEIPERDELKTILAGEAQLFSLTIVFGNPEAVEAQMRLEAIPKVQVKLRDVRATKYLSEKCFCSFQTTISRTLDNPTDCVPKRPLGFS